jgi:hypothetical protein
MHGNDPYGIRTRVTAVKGRCPRPLDEGAETRFSQKIAQNSLREAKGNRQA